MYKSIDTPAQNSVSIVGSLIDLSVRDGNTSAAKGSKPYRSMTTTIRVPQNYGGKNETSEISVGFFTMKDKRDGGVSKIYLDYGNAGNEYKWASRDGGDMADIVSLSGYNGNGSLRENMYVSKNSDSVVSGFQVDGRFLSKARDSQTRGGAFATWDAEIYILSIEREIDTAGEETGRLKIRGGIVQWGPRIDILDFYVEDHSAVDFVEHNYNVNDTAHFCGRIRITSETVSKAVENTWGEVMPKTTTRRKRELIITGPGAGGENGPYDEEESYDPNDIRSLVNDRNARRDQLKIEATNKAKKQATAAAPRMSMSWEDDE